MGPLTGIRVLEFEGIGPGPFCAMLLADLGADVLRVDRPGEPRPGLGRDRWYDLTSRGRRSVTVDLKTPGGVQAARQLAARADALVEGFRPGVMERLGLGPDLLLHDNPRLVYGRMTGWGQDGPLAPRAGHDIDYIALTGALEAIGPPGAHGPVPPLNLVGDFGGGGMLLAFGLVCALLEARGSGRGQVVDAAMVDGAALLATMFHGMAAAGRWRNERGSNTLDGGAPWYATYATRDGRHMAVGAIEPQFYAALLERLGLAGDDLPAQHDRAGWPMLRSRFAQVFATRTRDEWAAHFADADACVAPVRSFAEAPDDPHLAARGTFATVAGVAQPAAAPRFSRTPGRVAGPPPERGQHGAAALRDWGFDAAQVAALRAQGLGFDGDAA